MKKQYGNLFYFGFCMMLMNSISCTNEDPSPIQDASGTQSPSQNQTPCPPTEVLQVTKKDVILNAYAPLVRDVSLGATKLVVGHAKDNQIDLLPVVQVGDTLLIIQMQGAKIAANYWFNMHDYVNLDPAYGQVTDLQGAGNFEYVVVKDVDRASGAITFQGIDPSTGLKHSYLTQSHVQVVRVRQFQKLEIREGSSVTAPAWDGTTGGILAIFADQLALDGEINMSEKGFQGGTLASTRYDIFYAGASCYPGCSMTNPGVGAERGEGIAGKGEDLKVGATYGIGSPANSGGGGVRYGSGGGGGANGANGKNWTGMGVMRPNVDGVDYTKAWKLELNYQALADSSGGGRGGYSWSTLAADPLVHGPEDPDNITVWGGNWRFNSGGFGGHPLIADPKERLFLGGGGGAGKYDGLLSQSQLGNRMKGGAGGGMILLQVRTGSGSGKLVANGQAGGDATGDEVENLAKTDYSHMNVSMTEHGAGGGGAGGTIVLQANTWTQGMPTLVAQGGNGGNQIFSTPTAFVVSANGPGGGGGGGYIAYSQALTVTTHLEGGLAGTTNSYAMRKFPFNGATDGGSGALDRISQDSNPKPTTESDPVTGIPQCKVPPSSETGSKTPNYILTGGPNCHVSGAHSGEVSSYELIFLLGMIGMVAGARLIFAHRRKPHA